MKIASVTVIRHDGDIIEEFVRHVAQFVDEIFIYDNVSLDAAPDVLRSLQAEGLPIVVVDCDGIALGRDADVNDVVRDAWEQTDAEFMALLDADEFIVADSREAFEAELALLPAGTHASLAWKTYVPTVTDPQAEPRTLARIRHRLLQEQVDEEKVVLSRSFADDPHARVMLGSHGAFGSKAVRLTGAHLAHFPVRSLQQIQAKVLLGWTTFIALGYEGRGGFQWERLYAELKRNPVWSEREFVAFGQSYLRPRDDDAAEPIGLVYAPLPPVPRHYVSPEMPLMDVAIAVSRQLAQTLADVGEIHRKRAANLMSGQLVALASEVQTLSHALASGARQRDALDRMRRIAEGERDALLAYVHQANARARASGEPSEAD
jgi:hypothetical protein